MPEALIGPEGHNLVTQGQDWGPTGYKRYQSVRMNNGLLWVPGSASLNTITIPARHQYQIFLLTAQYHKETNTKNLSVVVFDQQAAVP